MCYVGQRVTPRPKDVHACEIYFALECTIEGEAWCQFSTTPWPSVPKQATPRHMHVHGVGEHQKTNVLGVSLRT